MRSDDNIRGDLEREPNLLGPLILEVLLDIRRASYASNIARVRFPESPKPPEVR